LKDRHNEHILHHTHSEMKNLDLQEKLLNNEMLAPSRMTGDRMHRLLTDIKGRINIPNPYNVHDKEVERELA
jgi:hypothetical protein